MENILRKALSENRTLIGTRMWSTDPVMTEVVGRTGLYHYVEFAAEYSDFTQQDLSNIARAAELHGLAP